ncbi:unnamed protein product [Menidia menidia]|uniref:(Atlantic silverside) hypothetical protein n=1 Tax=Menidia menidia TaxID=238744 RepID=A0A8S4BNF9_9TELE|nr:unnamed protein product [Menidia menidia]
MENPLLLKMDLRDSPAEKAMALISFYKRPNETPLLHDFSKENLATGSHQPLTFLLKATLSFTEDHACPAVIHVLLGGSPETATVPLEDCPDLDIRETISTVLGRVARQIKQLRRGLKETPIWSLVTRRPDAVPLPFQREEASLCPEVVLQHITWPEMDDESDEDDDCSKETICRISGYLKQFIANATPPELKELMKFGTGWENLPSSLSVEIVHGNYPTAATCCETLTLPCHYKNDKSFSEDFLACISSTQSGFGLL